MLYRFIDIACGAIVPLIGVLLVFCALKKEGARKTLLTVLLTLYVAGMVDVAGIPYVQTAAWNPICNLVPFSDLLKEGFSFWPIFQFAANVFMFVPLGVLLPMIWHSFRRFAPTLIAGALMSLCIELLQLFTYRVSAIDDLLMNTLGTAIGYCIVAGLSKKRWAKEQDETRMSGKRDRVELAAVTGSVFLASIFVKYALTGVIYSLPMFS